jgi:Arc/MetJ-type ribon-helix-helix transcriptional regulator
MHVESSVPLSDQKERFPCNLVDHGRFSSAGLVTKIGLDFIGQGTEAAGLAALRSLLTERQSAEFLSGPVMQSRISAMMTKKRHSSNLDI